MVVGLRSEADLLDNDLRLVRLNLLCLAFELVEELLVVGDAADRRIGFGRDLDQIEFHLIGQFQGLADRQHLRFGHIVAHDAHLRCRDLIVDAMRILLLVANGASGNGFWSVVPRVERPRRERFGCCDSCMN